MSSYSFQGTSRQWVPRDEEENRAIFSAMRQETGITMPDEFKPVYLENEEYEVEKWGPKQLIRLLRLYGSHRCLWDINDPFNKNRLMRRAAMIDISAAMGGGVTMEQVVQKINVIRSTYRYEKRRIKQRIRKGVGAKTKLKWFALADSFLRNVPRPDKLKKPEQQQQNHDSDSDLEDTVVFTIDPEILIPLEEDNSGNQNQISIAGVDTTQKTKAETDRDIEEINERMLEIHQMLDTARCDDKKYKTMNKAAKVCLNKWPCKQTKQFLMVYRKHRCLWDCSDANFKSRNVRRKAVRSIAKEIGPEITVRQVVRKITALRSTYRVERKKMFVSSRKESTLKWFPLADSFLRPFVKVKWKGENNISSPEPESSSESSYTIVKKEEQPEESYLDGCDDNFADDYSMADDRKFTSETVIKKEEEANTDAKESLPASRKVLKIRIKSIKRPWTQKESLQFVELYKTHPCLWDNSVKWSPQECHKAIVSISKEMDIPLERIKKRVNIFKHAYLREKSKIAEADIKCMPAYIPEFIWFPLADSFLSSANESSALNATTFVDTSALPPPTPQPERKKASIKKEDPDSPGSYCTEKDDYDFYSVDNAVNPIPSVAPSSVVAATPDLLFDKFLEDYSENEQPQLEEETQEMSEVQSPQTTKNVDVDVDIQPLEIVTATAAVQTAPALAPLVKIEASTAEDNDTAECENRPDDDDNNDEDEDGIEFPQSTTNEQPTKLIWNGLEDDLLEGKWSLKHSVKFLRLYGAHRCLWDLNDPDFRSRELRNAAIEDIAAAMGFGLDFEYVSKKIKIFRITYMQHRKRMLEAIKAGHEPEIQLKWFPLADSFLRPHIGLRSIKADEQEMPQFNFHYVYANLNLIDPALLNDFVGKGTQNSIEIGVDARTNRDVQVVNEKVSNCGQNVFDVNELDEEAGELKNFSLKE